MFNQLLVEFLDFNCSKPPIKTTVLPRCRGRKTAYRGPNTARGKKTRGERGRGDYLSSHRRSTMMAFWLPGDHHHLPASVNIEVTCHYQATSQGSRRIEYCSIAPIPTGRGAEMGVPGGGVAVGGEGRGLSRGMGEACHPRPLRPPSSLSCPYQSIGDCDMRMALPYPGKVELLAWHF